MKKRNSSHRLSTQIKDDLTNTARTCARDGQDIRPGSKQFWDIVTNHMVEVSELLSVIHEEVQEEKKANTGETRACIECGGPIIKKHVRGRWPIYCEECR